VLPPQARDSSDDTNLPDSVATSEPEADAAITDAPGTVLAILTADCLPVVFAADDGSEVAAAHAGWRGLSAGVLEATVAAMHAPPARLLAWLGPAAGPQAYEIGGDVREAFLDLDARAEPAFVATRPGHWRIDLYALARMRLQRAGMAPDTIHGGGLCTISDPARFYSHRRDARTGRMATLVWRAP
jgi:polyphenol oxidase